LPLGGGSRDGGMRASASRLSDGGGGGRLDRLALRGASLLTSVTPRMANAGTGGPD
jgi:hypothetical protein